MNFCFNIYMDIECVSTLAQIMKVKTLILANPVLKLTRARVHVGIAFLVLEFWIGLNKNFLDAPGIIHFSLYGFLW